MLISIYDPVHGKMQMAREDGEVWEWSWYEGDIPEGVSSRPRFYADGEEITSQVTPYVPGAYYAPNYLSYNTNLDDGAYPTEIGCYTLWFNIATDWVSNHDCYHNEKYEGTKLTVNIDIFGKLNFNGDNLVPIDTWEWVKDTDTMGHYQFDETLRSGIKPFKAIVQESGLYRFQTSDTILHRKKVMTVYVDSNGIRSRQRGELFNTGDNNLICEVNLSQGDVVTVYVGPEDSSDTMYYIENSEYYLNVEKL